MRIDFSQHFFNRHDAAATLDNLNQVPMLQLAQRAALFDTNNVTDLTGILFIMRIETLCLFIRTFIDTMLF